ncbi:MULTISPECIES: flagellin [Clostridium]|uniref:Flagellin n=2 Tax=Clostridium TaxID=1485 RepID=A0A0D1AMY9_CLOBO|nr:MULTISPECIES: flagellin [Clostridium]MDU2832829.1 flagellin [Clostridium botulinum]MDU5999117.1 flagellin [Staphylococcus aureus]KIS24504.1 flagellin [Clostridium botulinum B2 450]MCW7998000.1 flagellin [Clostridium sp. cpc1]MDU4547877.1 flagellin [Clostridium botulinum]
MFVSSNGSLLNSFAKLTKNKTSKNQFIEKLSSGKRINRAADDAGGLSISESLKAQVRGLNRAEKNIQDGISMVQISDGAMDEITKTLHRMKELSVQASSGTLTDNDRQAIGEEFNELKENIDTIAKGTEFNGIKLLNEDKTLIIQTRDNPYASYDLTLTNNSLQALGIDSININTASNSNESIGKIKDALNTVIKNRVELGNHLNNLQHDFNNVSNSGTNLTSSLSRIEDVDMATALMKSVRDDVLISYNKSMLVAARQTTQGINTIISKSLL